MAIERTRRRPAGRPRQIRNDAAVSRRNAKVRPKRSYGTRLTQPGLQARPRLRAHIVVGVVLLAVAAVMVPTHLAEHAGALDPLPRNLEDIFLGFPMAGVLGIAGFVALIWRY